VNPHRIWEDFIYHLFNDHNQLNENIALLHTYTNGLWLPAVIIALTDSNRIQNDFNRLNNVKYLFSLSLIINVNRNLTFIYFFVTEWVELSLWKDEGNL
jgi:hypothetical protein